jgi:allantoin racemase
MRLLVLNPNTGAEMTAAIHHAAVAAAGPDVLVETVQATAGPTSIEGHFDEAMSLPGTLAWVLRRQDVDAYVFACFSAHPAIDAARELSSRPALGIAEASMALASLVGHRFSIVTTSARWKPLLEDAVRKYGYETRCASVRSSGLAVLDLATLPRDQVVESLVAEARRAVAEDGAEAIVLGCAGMADLDARLRAVLDVPIVESVAAGVTLASTLVRLGLATSKVGAYQPVLPRDVNGLSELFQRAYRSSGS